MRAPMSPASQAFLNSLTRLACWAGEAAAAREARTRRRAVEASRDFCAWPWVRWVIAGLRACLAAGTYPWPVFSPRGPSLRELAMQALSSVEGGYDLLAPKFDHTPFRTPDGVLDATAGALAPLGPFGRGLDVCCGTGAGLRVLRSLCQGPVTGVDFSTGMLAQARRAHPGAGWVRADARALPFAGIFDLAVSFGALGHFLPADRPALFAG